MRTEQAEPDTFARPMWRALAVFRITALAYLTILTVHYMSRYAHPVGAWPALAALAAWTAITVAAYDRPGLRRWPLLAVDAAVAVGFLLVTRAVVGPVALRAGVPTLTVGWLAAPALAWSVAGGRRLGAVAAIILGGTEIMIRGKLNQAALTGPILTLLAAVAVGHVTRLAVDAERRLHRAVELEAATRERERLARGIHDSVLQVLALVQRRGAELGGDAAELGRLAGEQEAALRALVSDGGQATGLGRSAKPRGPDPSFGGSGSTDLRAVLGRYAAATVTLATPATPVPVPHRVAAEVAAAVGSALDNVRRHAGPRARAWVLLEDDGQALTITVRDDGVGIPPGRLDEAAAAGRLGVAQAIRGRVRDLGGATAITSAPGEGTEIEIRLPYPARVTA